MILIRNLIILAMMSYLTSVFSSEPVNKEIIFKNIENRKLNFKSERMFWMTNGHELDAFSQKQKLVNPKFNSKYLSQRYVTDDEGYRHEFTYDYIADRCIYAVYSTEYHKSIKDCQDKYMRCVYDDEENKKENITPKIQSCNQAIQQCNIDHKKYKETVVLNKYCSIIYGDK